jgi:CelD/BcsL family acetyltransferase involved in cellulose biosynthesis
VKERDIERYLCKRVKELGGEVRKVQWIGRNGAPDRLVMLPPYRNSGITTAFVELKNPDTIKTFPADAHERAQHREHDRMRRVGQTVLVIGTTEAVDEWLGSPDGP